MIKRLKKYFELNAPYRFDPTDLTALIYVACTILGIMNLNTTVLFFIGSAIGFAFCFKCRRINLVVLNGSLFVLNAVSLFRMIF